MRGLKSDDSRSIPSHFVSIGRDGPRYDGNDGMLRNWRKAFESNGTLSKDAVNNPSIEAEVKRLREENRQLMIERDILKKATAFFAKESR